MTRNIEPATLSFGVAYEGYACALDTAERLLTAGYTLLETTPDIALGLFELGQEEIGKSFSFLAAFNYTNTPLPWAQFWKDYRSHKIKAHRAFFYEWISPLRIVSKGNGLTLQGNSLRGTIQEEKEAALYSNYESLSGRFSRPVDMINTHETANRAFTLLYLAITARLTKEALDIGNKEDNYKLFSDIPLRLLTQFTLQQDMTALFSDFAQRSETHKSIIERIREIPRKAEANYYKTIKPPSTIKQRLLTLLNLFNIRRM